jgi:CysZ protein
MPLPSPVPAFSPRASLLDVFQGLGLIGRAWRLILGTPRLLKLAALCALVTLVALVALVAVLWTQTPGWLGAFWARPETWWGAALWWGVLAVLFVVLFVVGANVGLPLVLAPLQDPLSELTEERCGAAPAPPLRPGAFLQGLGVSLAHTLARLFFFLLGQAVLLPLHLVPGVGSVAWAVLGTLWTMLWLAAEHLAAPMTRHLYPFAQVRRVLRQRWALCLGFGAGVYVLLWVPLLNSFFLPVAVVGGTLLYRGLLAVGDVPPAPDGK